MKVLICNNCKDIWIGYSKCKSCGSQSLTETHDSNKKHAKNYFKNYYNFPLKIVPNISNNKVFCSKDYEVFDFKISFDGDPSISLTNGTKRIIVECLNSDNYGNRIKKDLNLKFDEESNTILLDNKDFINILPYNNNEIILDDDDMVNIQHQLAEFILDKLCN